MPRSFRFFLALIVCLLLAIPVGCGGSNTNAEKSSEEPEESTEATTPDEELVDLGAPLGEPLTTTPEKRRSDEIVERLRESNVEVEYDLTGAEVKRLIVPVDSQDQLEGVDELTSLEEVEFAEESEVDSETLANLSKASSLTALTLQGAKSLPENAGAEIARIGTLTQLDLAGAPIDDNSLASLARLEQLRELNLSWTQVGDGAGRLADLQSLTNLDVSWTQLGDEQLRKIGQLPKLRYLNVEGSAVTEAAVKQLKAERPELEIDGFDLAPPPPKKPAEPPESEAKDAESENAEATEGETKEGETKEGERKEGERKEGETKEGEAQEGEAQETEAKDAGAKDAAAKPVDAETTKPEANEASESETPNVE